MKLRKNSHNLVFIIIVLVVAIADAKVGLNSARVGVGSESDREDGLTNDTIFLVNAYYAKYGLSRNPLKEYIAKKLMDEVSAAQRYYFLNRGGVESIPQDLKELGRKANSLYENRANERYPASDSNQLNPNEKKEICENFPKGLKDFYLDLCMK